MQKINISNNNIFGCGEEGILIKNVTHFGKITLNANVIYSNGSNGIALLCVNHPLSGSYCDSIEINQCVLMENKANGIYIYESYCNIQKCVCRGNEKKGLVIHQIKRQNTDEKAVEIKISNTEIHDNIEDGINLEETFDSQILLENCRIDWNGKDGIYSDASSAGMPVKHSSLPSGEKSKPKLSSRKIIVLSGFIRFNKKKGIHAKKQNIYIDDTFIKENGEYAIFCEGECKLTYSSTTIRKHSICGEVKENNKIINIYPEKKKHRPVIAQVASYCKNKRLSLLFTV